jgi:hypothetical protein
VQAGKAHRAAALALICAAAACATTGSDLERAKQSWQGATHEEVVARWGIPARTDAKNSQTWISEGVPYRAQPSVGFGLFGGGGRTSVGVGVGIPVGSPEPLARCERTMVFEEGRVVDQSWVGPAEFCYGFRRGG